MFKPHQPKRRQHAKEAPPHEPKRHKPDTQPPPIPQPTNPNACTDCNSLNIIESDHGNYCGDCGTVVDDLLLTTNYSYDAVGEQISRGNYIPKPRVIGDSNEAKDRLSRYGNRVNMSVVRGRITQLSTLLDQPALEDRATHLFEDIVAVLVTRVGSRMFGKFGDLYAAACIYIAGMEGGRPLTLVDLAAHAHLSVFVIGRAVKQVQTMLRMPTTLKDPLLLVERTVNRVFGHVSSIVSRPNLLRDLEQRISVKFKLAKTFPSTILQFISSNEQLRSRIIEVSGQVMGFVQSCSLDTGSNPAAIACAAVVIGIEHVYLADDGTERLELKRAHRDVISKLLVALNGGSEHTVGKNVLEIQRSLVSASQTAPWLGGLKITTDSVILHAVDVLSCYQKAQDWVFSTDPATRKDVQEGSGGKGGAGNKEKSISVVELGKLITELRKAPSFKRAEQTRTARQDVLSALDNGREPAGGWPAEYLTISKLAKQGVNRDALVTLPLSTLELLASSIERQAEMDRRELDSADLRLSDMSDDELCVYLHSSNKGQP